MSAPLLLQGTPEWLQARCGRVTASRVGDVIARTKTGWAAARATYMGQLLAERLTGQPQEAFVTPAMRWGSECEDQARAAYEYWTDQDVASVGFVSHPTITMSGASPDGLVGDDGLLEIKCPTTVTHIDTLVGDEVPLKHVPQIQWQLACAGRAWCDFVCFDPRMPESLRIFIRRVERDEALICELQTQVELFQGELDQRLWAVSRLQQARNDAEALACCACPKRSAARPSLTAT